MHMITQQTPAANGGTLISQCEPLLWQICKLTQRVADVTASSRVQYGAAVSSSMLSEVELEPMWRPNFSRADADAALANAPPRTFILRLDSFVSVCVLPHVSNCNVRRPSSTAGCVSCSCVQATDGAVGHGQVRRHHDVSVLTHRGRTNRSRALTRLGNGRSSTIRCIGASTRSISCCARAIIFDTNEGYVFTAQPWLSHVSCKDSQCRRLRADWPDAACRGARARVCRFCASRRCSSRACHQSARRRASWCRSQACPWRRPCCSMTWNCRLNIRA
jgi:hypothetical protein